MSGSIYSFDSEFRVAVERRFDGETSPLQALGIFPRTSAGERQASRLKCLRALAAWSIAGRKRAASRAFERAGRVEKAPAAWLSAALGTRQPSVVPNPQDWTRPEQSLRAAPQ